MLAPTRWRLRKAVKRVNEVLGRLHLEKHPDKTFIGRIERGFDFLGCDFRPGEPTDMSKRTSPARVHRLYEQEPGRGPVWNGRASRTASPSPGRSSSELRRRSHHYAQPVAYNVPRLSKAIPPTRSKPIGPISVASPVRGSI